MAERDAALIEIVSMVGEWDPDAGGWSARDWVAGPAGSVGVTLPGGVELDVDVATPDTFVGLWVEASSGAASGGRRPSEEAIGTLVALLGESRTSELLALRPGRPRPLGRIDELSQRRRTRQWSDPRDPGVDTMLTHHALALDQSTRLGASDLVVALSLLDAAVAAAHVDGIDLESRVRESADRSLRMLLDLWPDVGPADRRRVRDLIADVADRSQDDALRQRARRLVRELQGDLAADTRLASMAEPMESVPTGAPMARRAMAPSPVGRLLDVDVSTLAESYGVADAAGRATTASEAEVRLPGRADLAERLWARAHGRDGVTLAVSRFVAQGDDAVARLLVPPASLPGATLDVTDRPADPRPSHLASVTKAIEHGRTAARADRLDDRKEQFTRWNRSATEWRSAGDDDRARRAMQFAEDGAAGRRVPSPLLADPVIEAGG